MKKSLLALAAVVVVLSASAARADVIAGPTLNQDDSGWVDSGLGFTANVNSTLTSFTFQNQGLADTVDLVNSVGTILDSVGTAAGDTSEAVSVSWSLTAGVQYYLMQTTADNGQFAVWSSPAPSDTQITMTDTGDWSSDGLDSANFGIGGAAGDGTEYWGPFNNITTNGSAVSTPEPSSLLLLVVGLLGLVAVKYRKFQRSNAAA